MLVGATIMITWTSASVAVNFVANARGRPRYWYLSVLLAVLHLLGVALGLWHLRNYLQHLVGADGTDSDGSDWASAGGVA